jgi:hypothetical protein
MKQETLDKKLNKENEHSREELLADIEKLIA